MNKGKQLSKTVFLFIAENGTLHVENKVLGRTCSFFNYKETPFVE